MALDIEWIEKLLANKRNTLAQAGVINGSGITPTPYGAIADVSGHVGYTDDYWANGATGIGLARVSSGPSIGDVIADAKKKAAAEERARLLAKLEALRPMEEPYTRRDWALEQRGEQRMFDRILAALQGPDKKGGAE